MDQKHDCLSNFHPLIRKWFSEKLGAPTEVQQKGWPVIASQKHALLTAPTGSGKTLAAFLWAINQLITGSWPPGLVRILYVSPLRALNNDVRRNLVLPLEELKHVFFEAGENFPEIKVATRSGDTPSNERQRMLRRPPEILITTPESLNILLTSPKGRLLFTGVGTVIIDEIHAMVDNKRGTHLITAVERLVLLSGEFQRIALSATVRPLKRVADFVGGFLRRGAAPEWHYERRPVEIVRSMEEKLYQVAVSFPENARETMVDDSWWPALIQDFRKVIHENRSTLFFTNSRRTAEKVARLINEEEDSGCVYPHHGSLSREIRAVVEEKLKQGDLKAVVATNSLELGIDIGNLDRVVMIQSPPSIASALQRVGRAGHNVGEVSRGDIYPTHGRDFLDAAVIARCIVERDIEAIHPIICPLDVLAQVILSMTAAEQWDLDDLFGFIRTCDPYHELTRKQFDLVIQMLAGRYADTRLRELRSRISLDKIDNTIKARDGARYLIYLSGGTIPDRGYFALRVEDSKAKIGELDEEFVWERRVGETFSLGNQVWCIRKITHNEVLAAPAEVKPGIIPFWKAEQQNRSFHFAERVGLFLEDANNRLEEKEMRNELKSVCFLDDAAADELLSFLRNQREATGGDLPHRHHILIEHFDDPMNRIDSKQVIIHTLWGGRVNRPFALALAAAWEDNYGYRLEVMANNDSIMLMLPHNFNSSDIFNLVRPEQLEPLLRSRLENTGFFGSRFRESAGRALLLPRRSFRQRFPLWLNRLRAKKLMDAVISYKDFPILLESWRTCLQDEFDLENLKLLLDEIDSGRIVITEAMTGVPSPFAGSLIWKQTNQFMYEDDTPSSGKGSSLSDELISELVHAPHLRPVIPEEIINMLELKLKRTAPGYAPRRAEDLLDWLKERVVIPEGEWKELLKSMKRDHRVRVSKILGEVSAKAVLLRLPGADEDLAVSVELLPRLSALFGIEKEALPVFPVVPGLDTVDRECAVAIDKIFALYNGNGNSDSSLSRFLGQWMSFYGPVRRELVTHLFGLSDAQLAGPLDSLLESDDIVVDTLREGSSELELCDRENLEILLRLARKARQPSFRALPLTYLQFFLAKFQGMCTRGEGAPGLQRVLEQLFGYPASAFLWEEDIFPARLEVYYKAWLDSLLQTSDLVWFGCGEKKLSFSFSSDRELFDDPVSAQPADDVSETNPAKNIFPGILGKYSFFDIIKHTRLPAPEAAGRLWQSAWSGDIANDTYAAIRLGLLSNFDPAYSSKQNRRKAWDGGFDRWMASAPVPGNWFLFERGEDSRDILENEELVKDRVRLLLKRYGIIFRELLAYELAPLTWKRLFRTLRLMELSGEILSGYFFEDVPGIQFISHDALRMLGGLRDEEPVYWMNALDPASLCGVKVPGLKKYLPARRRTTFLVFRGAQVVLIITRSCAELEFLASPDDVRIPEYLEIFKDLMNRDYNRMRDIQVYTINGVPATKSEYAGILMEFGFKEYFNGLRLWQDYKAD